jgi:hypothetical protein
MSIIAKKPDPTMGEFDGFDPKALYQMIPVAESRVGFSVTTTQRPISATIEPTGIARFGGQRSFTPPTSLPFDDNSMELAPSSVATFDLVGLKEGKTSMVVRLQNGTFVESLDISVKNVARKTYSLCLLNDMIRRSPWYPANDPTLIGPPPPAYVIVRPLMERVKLVFKQQCNLELLEGVPNVFELNLNDKDLKDPIVLDATIRPSTKTNQELIIDAIPSAAFRSDFILIFTWDIREKRKSDLGGLNIGIFSFIDSVSPNRSFIVAHELAHAMGLLHRGQDVLMNPVPNSSLLARFEIDMINTGGTT